MLRRGSLPVQIVETGCMYSSFVELCCSADVESSVELRSQRSLAAMCKLRFTSEAGLSQFGKPVGEALLSNSQVVA